jgi:hypothetical protein
MPSRAITGSLTIVQEMNAQQTMEVKTISHRKQFQQVWLALWLSWGRDAQFSQTVRLSQRLLHCDSAWHCNVFMSFCIDEPAGLVLAVPKAFRRGTATPCTVQFKLRDCRCVDKEQACPNLFHFTMTRKGVEVS